jgi:glycine oxidase
MTHPWHIVGGGIIGLLCARELCAAGESVVVIDRQTVGRESSWAGGGILSPLYPWRYPAPIQSLSCWSQAYYPKLARELESRTGIDAEWTPSGLIIFNVQDVREAESWAANHNVEMEAISATKAGKIAPLIHPGLGEALWLPKVAQIRNPRLLAALSVDLRQSGVEFRENAAITGFRRQAGQLVAIQTSEGEIRTNRCLLTAGAWTGELLVGTGLVLPIKPIKGQMLLLAAQGITLKQMILKDNFYLIPRRDGQILIGSTLENAGYDKTATHAAREVLLRAAAEMVPALAGLRVERQWAGLRPGSHDGIPSIGQHPDISGLFVCSGHFRNGIVLAPASARLVTDLMLGRTPLLDQRQFQLPQP